MTISNPVLCSHPRQILDTRARDLAPSLRPMLPPPLYAPLPRPMVSLSAFRSAGCTKTPHWVSLTDHRARSAAKKILGSPGVRYFGGAFAAFFPISGPRVEI